ncbi:MAG: hypothetical protein E7324_05830 [Clostridiales bacterium]|nr:hypothetical protein [Clostridiales bacterium]
MKKLGILLLIVGILALLAGIIGLIIGGNSLTDAIIDLGASLGVNSQLSFGDQLVSFLSRNRIVLLVVGLVGIVGGALLKKKAK